MRSFSLRNAARLLLVSSVCATALALSAAGAVAQEPAPAQPQAQTPAPTPAPPQPQDNGGEQTTVVQSPQGGETAPAPSSAATPAAAPLYGEFKGVRIGTSRDEARRILGNPQEKDKQQDFFVLSDRERARVYYDDKGTASAVIVTYVGKSDDVPTPTAILGAEPEQKQDGSIYKIVRYPEAGYWVAYSRTAGEQPLTIITMQRIGSK